MNITFQPLTYFLGTVKLELDISHTELIKTLEDEDWISVDWRTPDVWKREDTDWGMRCEVKNFDNGYKSEKLNEIVKFIKSSSVHDKALDMLYTWPQFEGLYNLKKDKMKNFAHWHCHFHKDKPGYYLGPHTDYKRLVATGLILLTEEDSPDTSTTFMWEGKEENSIRLPSGYGAGWLHVNTEKNIHWGHNKSNKDRYSIMLGLTIKHPDD